eukprot:scaffold1886_cov298-Alexandrium_tamarense.AAC.11
MVSNKIASAIPVIVNSNQRRANRDAPGNCTDLQISVLKEGVVDVSVAASANEGLAKRQVRGNESDTSQLIRTKWDLLPEKLFRLG